MNECNFGRSEKKYKIYNIPQQYKNLYIETDIRTPAVNLLTNETIVMKFYHPV